MYIAARKAGTHRRRRAEQDHGQKGVATEIADQAEVVGVRHLRDGPVVVHARDGLHAPPIPVTETAAVDRFATPHVGRAVLAQGNRVIAGQPAGHAGGPEQFIANGVQGESLHRVEFGRAGLRARVHTGDELHLRFAEIGGDVRVGQRRAQRRRVPGAGQMAVRTGAQALFFHATAHACQAVVAPTLDGLCQILHACRPICESVSCPLRSGWLR